MRLCGFLTPPVSGDYVFYVCADDEGALFLSPDDSPEQKRQIAWAPPWNSPRIWRGGAASRVSSPIRLEAGKRYYVEALMSESIGRDDNLAVAWQMPGQPPPKNGDPPIPGTFLAYPATRPAGVIPAGK